ncbi:MAG: AAA family ATPase, partial [Candidatus Adiutrix sp.]|nr:AAA family ATPase [Candidatus Adiutrix sp.]
MTTEELIKYIYETDLDITVFEDTQQKCERALILLSKYGDNEQSNLKQKFGDKVTFGNITPKKALEICKQLAKFRRILPEIKKKYVRIYADSEKSNIPGFEYSYKYIGAGSRNSPTYLNVVDVLFFDGEKEIRRNHEKNETKISALVLARLAFQVFYDDLGKLTDEQRKRLKTDGTNNTIGVWPDKESMLKKWGNRENSGKQPKVPYVADMYLGQGYPNNTNGKYFFYNCGLYDSMCLAQSFLKNFGRDDQYFEVIVTQNGDVEETPGAYKNPYSAKVIESKNVVFRGAPGTGKSYLAKAVAADIVSNGKIQEYADLSGEQKSQIEFVQFHPSYDYTDFVEGLRPKINGDGGMRFELQDGVFKKFTNKAIQNHTGGNFVFIIDEINRGEISKIFGELFFAIDPGYRGNLGEVSTQYANLHENPEEKFFIPDNVYIIGTMNDIDRSVDSFDFAMRRRFRFIEIKASDRLGLDMLNGITNRDEAIARLNALNHAISKTEELNENYHIGAAYFLKLEKLGFEQLWTDYLAPLLQDYVRGMNDEKIIL